MHDIDVLFPAKKFYMLLHIWHIILKRALLLSYKQAAYRITEAMNRIN